MLSFDEALKIALDAVPPPAPVRCGLRDALGKVLAETVAARTSHPPFDASAMDGYAVRASDITVGGTYEIAFEVAAGGAPLQILPAGKAARIFTGASVPANADSVIIQENAVRNGDMVTFGEPATPGQNIREKGRDFADGTVLAKAGTRLTPAQIGLIASGNYSEFSVFVPPRVGLLSTGDELATPGSELVPGQIVGSNGVMLEALLRPFAASIIDFGNAPDTIEALCGKIDRALSNEVDLLVTTGGASVGDHDLLGPALERLGAERLFWKSAMRPGKPAMLSRLGNKLIFTLPGNPVSAFVTATVFVLPAMRKWSGEAVTGLNLLDARLKGRLEANGARRHFRRGNLTFETGTATVSPIAETDSAHQSSLAAANALIVQPENGPELGEGALVPVLPL
ncbi:MAG: molybdopterin molybdotransferase MoeA [Hyphomicrobiaceae bacterium]|nr:molybdopterin molybdotransferase MoeA [Hyphomicrobiaceae bacterium]